MAGDGEGEGEESLVAGYTTTPEWARGLPRLGADRAAIHPVTGKPWTAPRAPVNQRVKGWLLRRRSVQLVLTGFWLVAFFLGFRTPGWGRPAISTRDRPRRELRRRSR